ncbi:hypothetical protein [Pseudoalteromonas piscicida]|uniref:hypothetical protein n=1 Tax=Pseudoalteromonas piscicida TaxID=43662 RepID=UPI0032C14C80
MKYQKDLDEIPCCPPQNAQSKSTEAYRIVHNPLCCKSFIPPGKISPSRVKSKNPNNQNCSLLALSFFTNEQEAISHYKALEKRVNNIHKTLGGYLAFGKLSANDGLQTPPGKNTHFDFYESKNSQLDSKFKIIKKMSKR